MADSERPSGGRQTPESAPNAQDRAFVMPASPARRRWRIVGRVLGVLACLAALAGGTVFGTFYWRSGAFRDMVNRHGWDVAKGALKGDPLEAWSPDKQFPDRTSMNVLVLGVDHDYDDHDRIIPGSFGRSDSILLAHVDFVNKTISALTIPRDTAVHIPGHEGIHKINAAHSYGGPDLSCRTIESVFGVRPDAYVEVGLEAFQKIVNAIGGIDVDVPKKLDYDDNWGNLHIHLKPGYQHLNGYQAMGFVRMRHSDSDEMRSKRQHEFLEALRTKLKSRDTFMAIPDVINAVNDELKGNVTRDQMLALANFARSLPKENINVKTLPSFEGPSYVTIYPDQSAQLIEQMFFPNQQLTLNIDAPDPNAVREMNAPYERGARSDRGSRHHRRGRSRHRSEESASPSTGPASGQDALPPADSNDGGGPGVSSPSGPAGSDAGSPEHSPDPSDRSERTAPGRIRG